MRDSAYLCVFVAEQTHGYKLAGPIAQQGSRKRDRIVAELIQTQCDPPVACIILVLTKVSPQRQTQ